VSSFWVQSALRLAAIAAVAVLVGSIEGPVWGLAIAVAALLLWKLLQLYYLYRLAEWIEHPKTATLPDGSGAWSHIFAILYRANRVQERSRERLQAALQRFRHGATALPDGVTLLTADNYIDWCNPTAERHLGIDAVRDRGLLITNLLRHPSFSEYLDTQNFREPLTLRSPVGAIVSVQLVPFEEASKMLISRDVTQLERVETVRRDFIANVSHELRTPLTVVGGFLETMLDAPQMPAVERRKQLQLMHDQAVRMQRLVDDLLVLSRLESHSNVPREEPVDVPALLARIAEDGRALSQGRHALTLNAGPQWLVGSGEELASAFGNLVNNAVRYTPAGGTVAISWTVENGQGVVRVEDNGVGIAPEHLPRLTERFYRIDRSRSRETGGTGLGLAIVKHVLTRHQAALDIRSTPGKGSTFAAAFPARRVLAPGGEPGKGGEGFASSEALALPPSSLP
jgi:two-component system phosphate regulon sensor histidine kinase PhoR